MFETYQKRSMYIICTLIFCMLIDSCSSIDYEEEKDYIYYNWCEDWQNTTDEPIPCLQERGVIMSVNVSKNEVNVVTFMLPPVDPIAILFEQAYCTHPRGAVSKTLFYSFSNSKPNASDNDGIIKTRSKKTVIKRPSILEPSTIYIGIEGEEDFNTLCFHLSIGPASTYLDGAPAVHVSKEGKLIRGAVSASEPTYLTIYNQERHPISMELFEITFSNVSIRAFYSFTDNDPDSIVNDGVLTTNNETLISWPEELLSQTEYKPAIYIAIEKNVEQVDEGNSTFLLFVKSVQEKPGFWARWFGWLG